MRVLGVDPGLSRCGVAVVEGSRRRARALRAGVVRTPPDLVVPQRLATIHAEVGALLADHRPAAVALERVFFNSNVRTAMGVGQAAGVVMLAAAQADVPVFEYTPTRMKAVVTGSGAADKEQVAFMVQTHLRLPGIPRPPDAADALALALCHLWESDGRVTAGPGPGSVAPGSVAPGSVAPGSVAPGAVADGAVGGMSARLAAAVERAGPGAQVVAPRDGSGRGHGGRGA